MALKKFLMAGIVVAVLVACGDDDSSDFATRPSGDSSSACEDCDGSSSSKVKSSSSKAKSSSFAESSSSLAKSSSSKEIATNSSSSRNDEGGKSSSSDGSSSSFAKSSSSSVASSSSILVEYVDPSTVVKGTMTDERDGKTYKTVKIGTQTWMAENLNYVYLQPTAELDSSSFCYNDSASYCEKYGRLYLWSAAMDSVGTWSTNSKGCGYGTTCSPTYPVRGICPEGWHLPTKAEFETLFTAVGGSSTAGKMLKSTSGWKSSGNGTDACAFSALPAGHRNYNGHFFNEGYYAYFWSSTEGGSDRAYRMSLYYDYDNANLYNNDKSNGFSVRCLKD